jgi:hypothetical protein
MHRYRGGPSFSSFLPPQISSLTWFPIPINQYFSCRNEEWAPGNNSWDLGTAFANSLQQYWNLYPPALHHHYTEELAGADEMMRGNWSKSLERDTFNTESGMQERKLNGTDFCACMK